MSGVNGGRAPATAEIETIRPDHRVGGWAIMGDRVGIEAMCRIGVDFIGIDCQHGYFSFDHAASLIQVTNLCNVPCYVRLTRNQLDWIPRYLDAGADGIVVAMVNSAQDAHDAVMLARYQPDGLRSYGGGKRNGVGEEQELDGWPQPEIFPMIETAEALQAATDVGRVPGVSGLFVGPVDLGLALRRPYPLATSDGPWREAVGSVAQVCRENGIRPGMFATDGDDARDWFSAGFQDVVLSSDIALLRRAIHEQLLRARSPRPASDQPVRDRIADPYSGR